MVVAVVVKGGVWILGSGIEVLAGVVAKPRTARAVQTEEKQWRPAMMKMESVSSAGDDPERTLAPGR